VESVEIELTRERAKRDGTTLNDTFRKWLREYACSQADHAAFQASIKEMHKATSGTTQHKFTKKK
jgi:hypothetical protein